MLREQLSGALRAATEAHDQRSIAIVRLIHAALKERDQKARGEGQPDGLSDRELRAMLQAMVDQRCQSIRRYEENGQLELAEREVDEIEIIKRFLPPQLDEQACAQAIREVIHEIGAEKLKDTGRVMSELKSRYPGRMDFAKARRMICQELG
ncbi:MAG: GatB/YqeY domain-containing protein [Geminicoccaceae bacterium]